jgi:hypothetical protein
MERPGERRLKLGERRLKLGERRLKLGERPRLKLGSGRG